MAKYYSPDEFAKMYGVHKQTVWRWIREGKLNAIRIGNQYHIRQKDIDDMEARNSTMAMAGAGA